MHLRDIREFKKTGFQIPRLGDSEIINSLKTIAKEGGYAVEKSSYSFTFSDQGVEYNRDEQDEHLQQVLALGTVAIRSISFQLSSGISIQVEREWEHDQRKLKGNLDSFNVSPRGQLNQGGLDFAKLLSLARKQFQPADTKHFIDFLDEQTRQLYLAREQDLHKLEELQKNFVRSLTQSAVDQQQQQQEFRQKLETDYASRQTRLEAEHQDRLRELEKQEAELKRVRAEIDDRENRQARRDIYKDLKDKLDKRNKSFELTDGTKRRRRVTFGFTIFLLMMFGTALGFCFYKNVASDPEQINWVAVGSQIGFAAAFIGVATFFIRWNNQWSQRHAQEEFKLKRLDLDIDRANWLVELAMEWRNITNHEIPPELVEKLARSLFVSDETKEADMHPAETLLSALFGKSGSVDVEFPGKLTVHRSDQDDGKKGNAEKR